MCIIVQISLVFSLSYFDDGSSIPVIHSTQAPFTTVIIIWKLERIKFNSQTASHAMQIRTLNHATIASKMAFQMISS